MAKLFEVKNLMNGFFDGEFYDLEFTNGWIKRIPASEHEGAKTDEYYWDNQINIDRAIESGEIELN